MVKKNSKVGNINETIKSFIFIFSILVIAFIRLLYLKELDPSIRDYLDILLIIFVPLALFGLSGHIILFSTVYPNRSKNLDELLELYESKYKKGRIAGICRYHLTEWLLSKKLLKDSPQAEKFVDFYIDGFLNSEKESVKNLYFSEPFVFFPSWFWARVLEKYSKTDPKLLLLISYYAPTLIIELDIKKGDKYAINRAISFLENIKKVESIAVPPKAHSWINNIFRPLIFILSFKRRFPANKYSNEIDSALQREDITQLIDKLKRKL